MKKTKKSRLGFTIAELLIVVAIIAVLVGVSIPLYLHQSEKAKIATNQANIRAASAAANADYLAGDNFEYTDVRNGNYVSNPKTMYGVIYAYDIKTGSLNGTLTKMKLPYDFLPFESWVDTSPKTATSDTSYIQKFKTEFTKATYIKNGIYQYILVFESNKGIYTLPYYDSATNTIVGDWEG